VNHAVRSVGQPIPGAWRAQVRRLPRPQERLLSIRRESDVIAQRQKLATKKMWFRNSRRHTKRLHHAAAGHLGSFKKGRTPKKSAMSGETGTRRSAVAKSSHSCLKGTIWPINVKKTTTPDSAIQEQTGYQAEPRWSADEAPQMRTPATSPLGFAR
jgi:hypothetical protein